MKRGLVCANSDDYKAMPLLLLTPTIRFAIIDHRWFDVSHRPWNGINSQRNCIVSHVHFDRGFRDRVTFCIFDYETLNRLNEVNANKCGICISFFAVFGTDQQSPVCSFSFLELPERYETSFRRSSYSSWLRWLDCLRLSLFIHAASLPVAYFHAEFIYTNFEKLRVSVYHLCRKRSNLTVHQMYIWIRVAQ